MTQIKLRNGGSTSSNTYYPRLQINKGGEIILALYKHDTLTTGILVDKTPESMSRLTIGQRLDDWEVCGDLSDYDGEVKVSFINDVPTEAFDEIIGGGHGGLLTQYRALSNKENLTDEETALKNSVRGKAIVLIVERDQIIDRFSNRTHKKGDKQRLVKINAELY